MQERFYFGDHVLPFFETGIPLLKQRLHQLPDVDNVGKVSLCFILFYFILSALMSISIDIYGF